MENPNVPGLRVFLLIVLEMISKGEIEGCSEIEAALTNGVATALYKKHPAYFEQSISLDNLENINEYFKKWAGCANGEEYRKYLCNENQGLYLLIVLALNEIY